MSKSDQKVLWCSKSPSDSKASINLNKLCTLLNESSEDIKDATVEIQSNGNLLQRSNNTSAIESSSTIRPPSFDEFLTNIKNPNTIPAPNDVITAQIDGFSSKFIENSSLVHPINGSNRLEDTTHDMSRLSSSEPKNTPISSSGSAVLESTLTDHVLKQLKAKTYIGSSFGIPNEPSSTCYSSLPCSPLSTWFLSDGIPNFSVHHTLKRKHTVSSDLSNDILELRKRIRPSSSSATADAVSTVEYIMKLRELMTSESAKQDSLEAFICRAGAGTAIT